MNRFGNKIRELREAKGMLLREVAAILETDTAHISKLERGDRKAKREHVILLTSLLKTTTDELFTLWLADQIDQLVINESVAIESLNLVLHDIKNKLEI